MVKPRKAADSLQSEFAGGLLPGLTSPLTAKTDSQRDTETARRQSVAPPSQHSGKPVAQARRKVTLYLDDPQHFDLIDELLSRLRRTANLPRDQSMLVRALLNQAAPALGDSETLQALAEACNSTLPNR